MLTTILFPGKGLLLLTDERCFIFTPIAYGINMHILFNCRQAEKSDSVYITVCTLSLVTPLGSESSSLSGCIILQMCIFMCV